jgi:hypothetical protein
MLMEKYVGRTVEIIYQARNGKLTQRLVHIRKVQGSSVWAMCLSTKGPRTFRAEQILAAMPVDRRVG